MAAIIGCGLSLSAALLAIRLDQAGFSALAIGLNTAAEGVAALAVAPFVPRVARHWGVARLMMAAMMTTSGCLVGFTLTNDYAVWLLLRLAIGASATTLFILSEFWITGRAPTHRTGLVIAVYITSLTIGSASGPLILAAVGPSGTIAFLIAATFFLAGLVPLGLNARDAPVIPRSQVGPMFAVFRRTPAAMLAGLLHGAIEAAVLSLLPIYALRSGMSFTVGASSVSLFVLGTSMLQIPIGWLADKVDRGGLLVVLAGLGTVGAVLLGAVGLGRSPAFQVALLAWSGLVGAFYPVGLNLLGRSADDCGRVDPGRVTIAHVSTAPVNAAQVNAAYVMTYAFGMMVGPPLVGAGLDFHPPSGLFWAMAALSGAYAAVFGVPLIVRLVRAYRPNFP